jgi:hypothetical protein
MGEVCVAAPAPIWVQTRAAADGDALSCVLPPPQVGIQLAGRQGGGFGGKALLRHALATLLALTRLAPAEQWAAAWAQLGGSFWLSRLSRDVEAVVRAAALALLAALLQPGAEATQHMVVQVGGPGLHQAWPGGFAAAAAAAAARLPSGPPWRPPHGRHLWPCLHLAVAPSGPASACCMAQGLQGRHGTRRLCRRGRTAAAGW